jgi:23S rRNA pseudouridine2605 synthase
MIRLSKWMSLKSLCSRREAEEFIQLGLVRVGGRRVFENMLVPYEASLKAFTPAGIQVKKPITKLWMINKPRGYICTHRDPQRRNTLYELFPPSFSVFGHLMTVGRLDFNSEGLLLVTNDNSLKALLENPSASLTRVYRVKVHGRVSPEKLQKMNSPISIKGVTYGPLNVNIDRELSTNVWLNVSMRTGKNREIRRVMEKCDLQVNKLIRVSYGPYKIGPVTVSLFSSPTEK